MSVAQALGRMHNLRRSERGFTFIEVLVVIALILLIALIGIPYMINILARAKHEGAVRNAASLARAARLNAIRHAAPVYLHADTADNQLASYQETSTPEDADYGFDPADPNKDNLLGTSPFPAPLTFGAPGAEATVDGLETDGGGNNWAEFEADGSVRSKGAFRIADDEAADAANWLEIRIEPEATAKVAIRKWDGAAWREQGEGGVSWTWE